MNTPSLGPEHCCSNSTSTLQVPSLEPLSTNPSACHQQEAKLSEISVVHEGEKRGAVENERWFKSSNLPNPPKHLFVDTGGKQREDCQRPLQEGGNES